MNLERIALGTVQFGLGYGVANQKGQVELDEIREILDMSRTEGLDTIDTAIGYGESEAQLGRAGVSQWDVITKLPALPDSCKDIEAWVCENVTQSLNRLCKERLEGLLLHRPADLMTANGDLLYNALEKLKDSDLVQKIGISIYSPDELDCIAPKYQLDVVQAPFSILDRRLKESGWLARLSKRNVEVHVRSVFLQGLLLMTPADRPSKFDRWKSLWDSWDAWLELTGLSALQACLGYVLSEREIDRVVIGVDGLDHLKENLLQAKGDVPVIPDQLCSNDIDLINPARWDLF